MSVGARRPTRLSYSPRRSPGPHMASMCVWCGAGPAVLRGVSIHWSTRRSLVHVRRATRQPRASGRRRPTSRPGYPPSNGPISLSFSHLLIWTKKKHCLSILIIYIHSIYMTLKYTNTYIFNLIRRMEGDKRSREGANARDDYI